MLCVLTGCVVRQTDVGTHGVDTETVVHTGIVQTFIHVCKEGENNDNSSLEITKSDNNKHNT